MNRFTCLLILLVLILSPGLTGSATPPGGGQAEPQKNNNAGVIVAAGIVGAAIIGGLIWWRLSQPSRAEEEVTVRKHKGSVPNMALAEFPDENPSGEQAQLGKRVLKLMIDALKQSQAYNLQELSTGLVSDSTFILSAKTTSFAKFNQAEISIARGGKSLFKQTITWYDDRELRNSVNQLVNQITEIIK